MLLVPTNSCDYLEGDPRFRLVVPRLTCCFPWFLVVFWFDAHYSGGSLDRSFRRVSAIFSAGAMIFFFIIYFVFFHSFLLFFCISLFKEYVVYEGARALGRSPEPNKSK